MKLRTLDATYPFRARVKCRAEFAGWRYLTLELLPAPLRMPPWDGSVGRHFWSQQLGGPHRNNRRQQTRDRFTGNRVRTDADTV